MPPLTPDGAEMAFGKPLFVPKHPGLEFSRIFGYPQSCAVEAGGLIFCSGMVAVNPVTGEREHGTVTSETRRIFENLKILLEENDSNLARIVQVHAMIYSRLEYDVLNRVYRKYLPESPPARMVWQVVIESGFKVQLDVVAAAGNGNTNMALARQVIEPKNDKLNVSKNRGLPHSPGIRVGDFLFLSGMVSTDPETGEHKQGTLISEARQILENIRHLLDFSGSSLENVVKMTVFVYDMLEFQNVNDVLLKFFPERPPALTVCGAQLSFGFKIEIECIAIVE
jgi:2-iminobutanoate/2-iminopropanoate deaminase